MTDPIIKPALRILSEAETDAAIALGLAVRVAQKLTGGTARPLRKTKIYRTRRRLGLKLQQEDKVLFGDSVARRLNALAKHLDLKATLKLLKP